MLRPRLILSLLGMQALACGDDRGAEGGEGVSASEDGSGSSEGEGSVTASSTSSEGGDGPKLDVAAADMGGNPMPTCKVVNDMDAIGDCGQEAPPDSFDPEVQWVWGGLNTSVIVTPVVVNLTDDNDDGEINLCDIPDVVVVTDGFPGGRIKVLDGATGIEHFTIDTPVAPWVAPAVGDIDKDGFAEIIAASPSPHRVLAFDHEGETQFTGAMTWTAAQGGALAIADVDADGFPEILADGMLVHSAGGTVWKAPEQTGWFIAQKNTAPIAADLDGDESMEFILGQSAYRADGSEYWNDPSIKPGYPQVANLDDDDDPEVLINNWDGITILEHDGSIKVQNARPTGDPVGTGYWFRPATVHDFDGDGLSEFAVSSASNYSVFEANLTVLWSAPVQDGSGWAAGTAFDFLGDGEAEAMYSDEVSLFVFDGTGSPIFSEPRSSKTLIEYPIVVDVDNDGSSEILVVSSPDWDENQTSPALQVFRDKDDRWIQARRIWNQHTYHVTNVREDGTIPQFEKPSWEHLNTYRTNAQIEDGAVCKPDPEG